MEAGTVVVEPGDLATRYQVGREAKALARVRRVLPDRVKDAVVRRALR